MKSLFAFLLQLFFPDVCAACENLLLSGEYILCTHCRHELPLTGDERQHANETFQSFYGKLPLERAAALLYFSRKGNVQHMIHKLKYRRREAIGALLGKWHGELLDTKIWKGDYVIPVPLHPKKWRIRGYNQVSLYGKSVADKLGVPFRDDILKKTTFSKTQSKKSFLERTSVKDKGFDVQFDASVHNKHFILVDDVLTTGATLEACGRALLKIPGAKLSILTMAVTQKL